MSPDIEKWFNPSEGEDEIWCSNPSLVMNLPQLTVGVIAAFVFLVIAGVVVYNQWPVEAAYMSLGLMIVSLVFAGYRKLVYNNTVYLITSKRVMTKTGIVGRDTSSKPHKEIVRVDVNVSTFEAIVSRITGTDIGDIIIRSPDDTGKQFILENVPDVGTAEAHIEQLSGSGPNDNAKYGTDPRSQSSPNRRERQNRRKEQQRTEKQQSPPDKHAFDDSNKSTTAPAAPEPDAVDDEFDAYEPSDKA